MAADNELWGGTIGEFADSMANEIEQAYQAVLAEEEKDPLPSQNKEDRRMLFIAIARGVINHLAKKQKAFQIQLPANPDNALVTPALKVKLP